MEDRFGISVFLLLLSVGWVHGNCPDSSWTDGKETLEDTVEGWHCASGQIWESGDAIKVVECLDNAWPDISTMGNCISPTTVMCAGMSAPAVPDATAVVTFSDSLGFYMKCNSGKEWLSGEPGHVTQCLNGNFTVIHDVCTDECQVPMECSMVADLGFAHNGIYTVIPSGNRQDDMIKVSCWLGNENITGDVKTAISGWTLALSRPVDSPAMTGDYELGIGEADNETVNYFIGMKHIFDFTNDSANPLVFMFEMVNDAGEFYYAIYDNIQIGPSPDYALQSVGLYHGTAGDDFHSNADQTFQTRNDNTRWWGDGSTGVEPTAATMKWGDVTLTEISLYIRPQSYDTRASCPPLVDEDSYWTRTSISFTSDRAPGDNITFDCLGELVMGMMGSENVQSGVIYCEIDPDSGTPAWSSTLELPCALVCPENFTAGESDEHCYLFSEGTAEKGLVGAALQCARMGATLAVINNTVDLVDADDTAFYYTAHTQRGASVTSITPETGDLSELQCDSASSTCAAAETTAECLAMTQTKHKYQMCNDTSTRFICMTPGYCPDGYTRYEGHCYKILESQTGNFKESFKTCAGDGAALAVPEDMASLGFLTSLATSLPELPMDLMIGINYAWSDWSIESHYELEEDVITAIGDPDQTNHWYAMTVPDSTAEIGTLKALALEENGAVGAICQHPGPIACWDLPPEASGNMIRNEWTGVQTVGTELTFTCYPGYFFNGEIGSTTFSIECISQIGGWWPKDIPECTSVEVCPEEAPTVPSQLITQTPAENYRLLNGTVSYTCPTGMAANPNVTTQILTCEFDGTNYAFQPTAVEDCTVCLAEPKANNSLTDWVNTNVYAVNETVTATCNDNYMLDTENKTQQIKCTTTGWSEGVACYEACPDAPLPAGENANRSEYFTNAMDTILYYTCTTGMYFRVNEEFPEPIPLLTALCNTDHKWLMSGPDTSCSIMCLNNPPGPPSDGNSSWNNVVGAKDDEVTYTCNGDKKLPDLNTSFIIRCGADGNWTIVEESYFNCRTQVTVPLPTVPESAIFDGPPAPYWVGQSVNYTCNPGMYFATGSPFITVTFNGTDWVGLEPDMRCLNVCASPPPTPPTDVSYNYTGLSIFGSVVEYYCPGKFPLGFSGFAECKEGNWSIDVVPPCRRTTPGPTTTEASIILSTLAPYPVDYPVTTNYYWATLQNNMSDCHGRKSNFKQTNGPFGFGYATEIDESHDQCQIHKDFSVSGDLCAKNPAECTDGFSISLWEKTTIDFDDYKALNDSTLTKKKKYFISTGGDADGHPGVAVYQEGWWLHALVSTGEKVWKVKAAGALRTDKWNNIALRWENTDNSHGLQLLVNLELKAQIQVPETKTALEPLDPPEMMIGCHKTKAMDDYGFYNTFVADELAIWTRFIDDDENRKFLGGYQENFEDVAVADFQKMLQNVNMADEDQLAAAVDVLDKMTASEPDPADENSGGNPSPTSASASSTTKDKATASSPTASSPATTAPPMDKDFPTLLEIIQKLMDTKNVPLVISEETAKKRLRVLAPMSNVIGNPNKHNWDAIHSDKYEKGSVELILGVNKLTSKLFRSLNYTNTSIEFTMDYPNLVMQVKKTTIADLKEEGCRETPDYKTIPERAKSWNYPIDRCRVCGDLFSDPICDNRPVTVVTTVYSSLHNTMPMRYNTEELSIWSIYELDACIQNVDLVSDVERDEFGDIDPRMPNCTIDPKLLAKRPFVCKAEHKSQPFIRTTMKQLKFHENEFKSTIKRRLCVWWNTKLHEGLGGWDTQGCVSLHTQDGFTKCACKRVGLMSILAENTEAKVVPDEQLWLTVVKYIGYILSFLCLIAFIAIVAIFGDLKDMFHLMGLNLAVAQFLGSVVMLISDMGVVRDDRHACTAIGTIIQYFFFASGSWAAFLGHASFKAITAGIVGGKLRAYGFIAWGLPLVSVGLTYLLFLHDLGDDPRCFISWDNNPKYAFFGPQLFFCALCISFGVIVLLNLSTPALRKDNLIEDYGSFCRGAAFVLLFFGLTWIFGFLAYMRFGFREPSFYPIFQVLNSWIGLMIFLFIGVGSKKFRMIVAGQAKLRRKLLLGYAFGTPHVPVEDTEQLGSPADQRKDKPRPSSAEENLQRPLSTQSNFLAPPASGRGMVAGRPGSTSPRPSSSGW